MQCRPVAQINIFLALVGVSLQISLALVANVQPNFFIQFQNVNPFEIFIAAIRATNSFPIPKRMTAATSKFLILAG